MAAIDYFLKIDGIDGESTDARHPREIELDSWAIGESDQTVISASGGRAAGKVKLQDFNFTTRISKASPKLFQACASGQQIRNALLTCRRNQVDFLIIKLSDVLVSVYQLGGATTSGALPSDRVTLAYDKIEMVYTEQRPDGSIGATVDVAVQA